MFVVKLVVGALSIITCVKIAKNKADTLKNVTNFWQAVIDFSNEMLINLSYKKSAISELFSRDFNSYDFNKLLKNYLSTGDFEYPDYILDDEKLLLNSFFLYLGKSDTEAQKTFIKSKETTFLNIKEKKQSYENKFYQVVVKVGFSVGVMLFILVI